MRNKAQSSDQEGTWIFWGGDWWLQEEDGWWRKWTAEQQHRMTPIIKDSADDHQSIKDSPEQEDNIEDLVNGLVLLEITES